MGWENGFIFVFVFCRFRCQHCRFALTAVYHFAVVFMCNVPIYTDFDTDTNAHIQAQRRQAGGREIEQWNAMHTSVSLVLWKVNRETFYPIYLARYEYHVFLFLFLLELLSYYYYYSALCVCYVELSLTLNLIWNFVLGFNKILKVWLTPSPMVYSFICRQWLD